MTATVLPATCAAQVVTTLPVVPTWQPALPAPPRLPIPAAVIAGATVMGQGVGPSTGVAVIDGDKAVYIADISPDLKAALDQVVTALTQVKAALDKTASALTAIDTHAPLAVATTGTAAAQTGTATWVPVAASDIANITSAATQIEAAKVVLDTLKGALR